MEKKKILVISGEFLPYTESVGGVIRIFSFLKTLRNYKKYIICTKSKFRGYFGLKKYLVDTKIIHINKQSKKKNNFLTKVIRYFFYNFLYLFGIDNTFFSLSLYKEKVINILNKEKINKIIISGPPFSIFYLVPFIKSKYPETKIILDYRDGWGKRIMSNFYYLKYFQHNIEKKIISNVNYVTAATKKIFKDIKSFNTETNLVLIYNGFLKLKNSKRVKLKLNNKKINIGYFGLISDQKKSYRNINILINSLDPLNNEKFHFHFFGNSKINKKVKKINYFSFYKNISYLNTQNFMKKFDYLLILHTEKSTSGEVITGKFYEYLLSKIPILVISNGQTEAGKIIQKNKIGYQFDYSKINLTKSLNKLNKKFIFKKKYSITKYNRDFQNKKLLRILDGNE